MKLTFCGGAQVVTGVNYLLETKKTKILIDCGLFQGTKENKKLNFKPFPFDPKEIDFVILTHAHLDHTGRLPLLYQQGFRGQVFCSRPTGDFAKLILMDSAHIWRKQERKMLKLFDWCDVDGVLGLFKTTDYHQKIQLNSEINFQFKDAGHILGSSIIDLEAEGKKIVFSGDLGNPPTPLLRDPENISQVDYVLIESTYGDRLHQSRQECKEQLENLIEETAAQKGVLMIPAFSVERTQQLLYELNELVENHRIPPMPIFIDSPLAIEATKIYAQYQDYFNKEACDLIACGDDVFNFKGLHLTQTKEESKSINQALPPKIIIAGSGMSEGGRICYHELHYLSDPHSSLLIVAYQAQGTLGRHLLEGHKKVKIFNQVVKVKAKIISLEGYSAHADQSYLLKWLESIEKPIQKVFVVQGEPQPAKALSQRVKDHLGLAACVPRLNQQFDL